MKLQYEWRANSMVLGDRSGTARFHVPSAEPVALALDHDRVGAEIARLVDAAYAAGRRDESNMWAQHLNRLAARRGDGGGDA